MNARASVALRFVVTWLLFIAAAISQAALVEIRASTSEELGFFNGIEPAFPRPIWESLSGIEPGDRATSDYWVNRGSLWRLRSEGATVAPALLTSDIPLSIITSVIDYRRRSDFAVSVEQVGNNILIESMEIVPTLQTLEFRFPEDMSKSFVYPVGTLAAGDYQVTVRNFSISSDFSQLDHSLNWLAQHSGDAIDFQAFVADPIGYDLPDGFSLHTTEEHVRFTVVPEPSTIVSCFLGLAVMASRCRRREGLGVNGPVTNSWHLKEAVSTALAARG